MKNFKKFLKEAQKNRFKNMNYKLYHDSMYNAFQEVKRFVKENGFEIDEENWDREVQAQGSWADVEHIDAGQIKKYNVRLFKDGHPTKNGIAFQIYHRGYGNNNYLELNMYMIGGFSLNEDFEMGSQEYLVTDCSKLTKFLDKEIGTEYDASYTNKTGTPEWYNDKSGSVTVFDLLNSDHIKIRKFIDDNNLWSE